jgi:hypothetical protein
MENPNEIFVPLEEPSGLIEATVERTRERTGKINSDCT